MLTHPAIAVAQQRVARYGDGFEATAIRTQGDAAAAVVMDNAVERFVVIVERDGEAWDGPGVIVGSPRPDRPRAERTPDHRPLQRLSRKTATHVRAADDKLEFAWFAVTGLAAEDATAISIVDDEGHETREPVDGDGLAFAMARIRCGLDPEVYVHTQDGRRVIARH